MCHKNPNQVIRLIDRCKNSNVDIVVHADINMSSQDYGILESYIRKKQGVFLTNKRLHGELDKRSLVDIVFEMLESAMKYSKQNDVHYKYFALLSGQDYLVKSIDWICEKLDENYPKPFIDCTPYHKDNWLYKKFNFSPSFVKYNEWITKSFKKGFIRSSIRCSAVIYNFITCKILKKSVASYLIKNNVELYGGSAWWILPDIAIDYIYKNKDSKISSYILDNVRTPEENYFQIMTMRSPIMELVQLNPYDMVEQNCKTWAYFSDEGKPFKGHPYIFTIQEAEKLENTDFWIARKFDEKIDNDIFDIIDEFINKGYSK